MTVETAIILAVSAAAIVGAAIGPVKSSAYIRKYWWAGLVVGVIIIAVLAMRKRRGKADPDGEIVLEQVDSAAQRVIDFARQRQAEADLDLARARASSMTERLEFMEAENNLPESGIDRREAILRLVERTK